MGTLSKGETGENPLEGGFWVGIMRGVIKASLAWVVILRGSFVLTSVCCARVGRFPVRMEKGSNNSRKSIVTYGFSSHLFPPHSKSQPIPTGCTGRDWFPTSWV